MTRETSSRFLWIRGWFAVLAMASGGACDGTTPVVSGTGGSTPDAAVDAPVDRPADVVDAVVPEVSLLANGCMIPNPTASGLPNPAMYDTALTGIVFDRITGLMWQRGASGSTFGQAGAAASCKGSKLGGYADWRLPTVLELVSIVDFTAASPSVDSLIFPGTSSNLYWTSTPLAGHPNNAWYVSFAQGATNFVDLTVANLARCVRTALNMPASCYAVGARFKVDAGLVTDASTGLTWQQAVPTDPITWVAARTYCQMAGAGFRLPSLKELQSIVDYGTAYPGPGPAIDPTAFPATPTVGFWTSSPVSGSASVMWTVKFDNGDTASNGIAAATDLKQVRCVR